MPTSPRKHQRVLVERLRVEYHRRGLVHLLSTGPDSFGSVVDVSEGGLRIMSNEALETETPITLTMQMPRALSPVKLKGEVHWCRRVPGNFEIGVTLDRPPPAYLKVVAWLRGDAASS